MRPSRPLEQLRHRLKADVIQDNSIDHSLVFMGHTVRLSAQPNLLDDGVGDTFVLLGGEMPIEGETTDTKAQ
jgi:hypothetical protein